MDFLRRLLWTPSGRRIHVAKTITWRVIATLTTVIISYAITGDLLIGATIGGFEATSKMVLYYGHERIWAQIVRPDAVGTPTPSTERSRAVSPCEACPALELGS